MSPCPPAEGFDGPFGMLNGSAGWGDAVVSVPHISRSSEVSPYAW